MSNSRILLSFDVDRTLVDRRTSLHEIAEPIKEVLLWAHDQAVFEVVLNTGRDFLGLQEIDRELGVKLNSIFLSGRVLRAGEKIEASEYAALPPTILNSILQSSDSLDIPFVDMRTKDEVIHLTLKPSTLPLDFQKPLGWFRSFSPRRLLAENQMERDLATKDFAYRIEIPVREQQYEPLLAGLQLDANFFVQRLPIHKSHLTENPSLAQWCALQILCSTEKFNKGTGLRDYVDRFGPFGKIIHFGDSHDNHNNDALVERLVSNAQFIQVEWNEDASKSPLSSLPNAIKALLHDMKVTHES